MLYEGLISYTAYRDVIYIIEFEGSIDIESLNLKKFRSLFKYLNNFNCENLIPVYLKSDGKLEAFDIEGVKRYIERLKKAYRNIEKGESNSGMFK